MRRRHHAYNPLATLPAEQIRSCQVNRNSLRNFGKLSMPALRNFNGLASWLNAKTAYNRLT